MLGVILMMAIENEIAELLGKLPQFMSTILRGCEITMPVELNTSERRTLLNIRATPGEPMCYYSRKAGLSRAMMTSIADRLEQEGWIKRQPAEDDRRSLLLYLTETGNEIAQATHEQYVAFIADKVSMINDGDKAKFRSALNTLITMMEKLN
jgi:DNA-binding MarR family transcriptional regulator